MTTTIYSLCILWKALAEHLVKYPELCSSATSILELGSGAGLVGLTAAMLSTDVSRVVLTDNNDRVLELLQRNIDINFAQKQRESFPFFQHFSILVRVMALPDSVAGGSVLLACLFVRLFMQDSLNTICYTVLSYGFSPSFQH